MRKNHSRHWKHFRGIRPRGWTRGAGLQNPFLQCGLVEKAGVAHPLGKSPVITDSDQTIMFVRSLFRDDIRRQEGQAVLSNAQGVRAVRAMQPRTLASGRAMTSVRSGISSI